MNHQRFLTFSRAFTTPCPEIVLVFPKLDRSFLTDIRISFWSEQSFPGPTLQTSEISDLRIYFNGAEITEKIRIALISKLQSTANAKEMLKRAHENWLKIVAERQVKDGPSLEEQQATATEIQGKDWSELFAVLATRGAGYRGSLHPINFLFREIALEPISIKEAIYPIGAPEFLAGIVDNRIVFSHGPSRFYSKDWTPVKLGYEGELTGCVAPIYADSWEFEMTRRLQMLSKTVLDLQAKTSMLTNQFNQVLARAANLESLVKNIETSTQEIINKFP